MGGLSNFFQKKFILFLNANSMYLSKSEMILWHIFFSNSLNRKLKYGDQQDY